MLRQVRTLVTTLPTNVFIDIQPNGSSPNRTNEKEYHVEKLKPGLQGECAPAGAVSISGFGRHGWVMMCRFTTIAAQTRASWGMEVPINRFLARATCS